MTPKYPFNKYSLSLIFLSRIIFNKFSKNAKVSSFWESFIDKSYKSLDNLKKNNNFPDNLFKFL